jgi:adenylate cyclase
LDHVVRIRLLGEFAITSGGRAATAWPRPTARRLCELVLVSPGRRISRDLACDELFPRLEPRTAARSLSKALSMARVALAGLGEPGAALLAADLGHIWVAGAVEVDAETHAAALRAGLAMPPGADRDETLAAALAEDGELLAGEPYAGWAAGPRERLDALRQEARLALARDRAIGSGRSGRDDVLAAWQSCLDHDPACEEAAGALVRGYFAQGRPELAARVFERCRAALEQLGLRISPSLERVYAAAAREHIVPAASPATAPASPPGGPAQPSSPPPREAGPARQLPREERRPVTVLFAEVAAPAGLAGAGALGLEALRDMVGGSLAAVIAEVEALGGTVISVSGRGLEAMFGAPEAHEDDPERALRAAFRALTASATAAAADGGTALRIGVETGPAVVGPVGGGAKVEYGAFGDVVSVAAALQSSARPGSVLAGPATRAITGHLFSWGAAEEVALSGHPRPLVASYLDAPRARVAERRPRLGGRAALVDRDAEMRVLDDALRAAVSGHGSVVLLTAEPGLGKTRLVQECRKRFIAWVGAGSGRLPLWLEGRCASYASAVPYSLYQQLTASWIGVSPDQPEARLRPALETALAHLMGNTNLLPPLARMMGAARGAERQALGRAGPEELQRMTFGAVRSVVSRYAAAGPTVLVLEDLHWADPTSLRLTLELAELATGRPLLVLATARPGAGPEVAALVARKETRQLTLRPLTADAAAALAGSLIGGQVAGPEVFATVLATADGNPLFLEERLSSLLETRTLVREQGTWRLRRTNEPDVPQVLERLVRSRVDRLGPGAQEAIRAAAVLGAEFTTPLLAAVLDRQPAALGPVLGELSASDLVHRDLAAAAADRYRFRHALLQEAIYLGLLRAERRDLHARAAAAVAAASSDRLPEVAAVIGHHYAAAGNAEQAVYYLELAGDHATDAFANEEAIASFRAALAVTERTADEDPVSGRAMAAAAVRLRTRLANVLWRTGRREEAKDAFRGALRLGDAVDPLLRAHLYTRLGRLELTGLGYEGATAAFDAAEALLGDHPGEGDSDRDAATADQWLEMMIDGRADMHVMRFEPDQALKVLETARPVLEAHGTPARRYVFDRLFTQQRLIRNRFQVDDADVARLYSSLRMAERTGEEKDLGYATHFLGWGLWMRGDLPEARRQLQSAHDMAERMGETFLRAVSLLTLTLTALRQHDKEAVRGLLPRAAAAGENADTPLTGIMAGRAWLAWQDGHPDEVIRLADQIARYEPATFSIVGAYQWVYLFPLIAARLGAGSVNDAVTAARQVLDPSQQRLPDDLTAALRAAIAAWDDGEPGLAGQHLESALRLARDRDYF